MIIRKATLDDLSLIQDLNLELFRTEEQTYGSMTNYNMEWTKGALGTEYFKNSVTEERACALVAVENETVVGYLVGWIHKKQNPCRLFTKSAEIENMLIKQSHRGKGIGKELVREFLKWAEDKEVDHVKVTALAGNTNAIEFYRSCGFSDYETTLEMKL